MGVQKRVTRATTYPVLALRGLVIFPQTTLHFEVAREKSVKALEAAVNHDQCLFLVSQKDMAIDEPAVADLNTVGVVVRIRQVLKMPSDTFRVAVEGLYRARIRDMIETEPHFTAQVKECLELPLAEPLLEKAFVRIAAVSISFRKCPPAHEQVNNLNAAVQKVHNQQHQIDCDRDDRAVFPLVSDRGCHKFHRLPESAEHSITCHKYSNHHKENCSRIDLQTEIKHILKKVLEDNI